MKAKVNPATPVKTKVSTKKKPTNKFDKELKTPEQKFTTVNTPFGKLHTVSSESLKDAVKKEYKPIGFDIDFESDPRFDRLNPDFDQIKEQGKKLKEKQEKIINIASKPVFPKYTDVQTPTSTSILSSFTPEGRYNAIHNHRDMVSESFQVDNQIFHSIPEFMAKHPQPIVPPGIKSEGFNLGAAKLSIDQPISTLINNLVKNKNYRNTIVKLVTGSNLDDLINETFSPETIKELGIEYIRDVVATSSIIKNYQKFLIWKAGFDYKK